MLVHSCVEENIFTKGEKGFFRYKKKCVKREFFFRVHVKIRKKKFHIRINYVQISKG